MPISTALARKRERDRQANDVEQTLVAREYFDRAFHKKKWASMSGVSNPASRANPVLDFAVIQQASHKLEKGGYFSLTERRACAVPSRTLAQLCRIKRFGARFSLSRKARARLSKTVETPTITPTASWNLHVPTWDHTSEVLKVLAYMACIPVHQRYAFSLRLTHDLVLRALASEKGVAKYFQDRIATELRKAFPWAGQPDFVMVLEWVYDISGTSEILPLHIHGVFKRPDRPEGPLADETPGYDLVREALKKAGGKVLGKKAGRQLDTRWVRNVIGWVEYVFKNRLATIHALNAGRKMEGVPTFTGHEGIVAATDGLRAAGAVWYAEARKSGERFQVAPKTAARPRKPAFY